MHGSNFMQRPLTGKIVLSDPFLDAETRQMAQKNFLLARGLPEATDLVIELARLRTAARTNELPLTPIAERQLLAMEPTLIRAGYYTLPMTAHGRTRTDGRGLTDLSVFAMKTELIVQSHPVMLLTRSGEGSRSPSCATGWSSRVSMLSRRGYGNAFLAVRPRGVPGD